MIVFASLCVFVITHTIACPFLTVTLSVGPLPSLTTPVSLEHVICTS